MSKSWSLQIYGHFQAADRIAHNQRIPSATSSICGNAFSEPCFCKHLLWCYWEPRHQAVCTWKALDTQDIQALPLFPSRWTDSVARIVRL